MTDDKFCILTCDSTGKMTITHDLNTEQIGDKRKEYDADDTIDYEIIPNGVCNNSLLAVYENGIVPQ